MSRWTVLFSSVIPASGTRQIEKTFIKGLLTIQVQELRKSHNKPKLRQQYRKSRFSGDKMAPLTISFPPHLSRHIGCFREFPNFKLLSPQSPRGFSALARLYYLARPTKTAMLQMLRFATQAKVKAKVGLKVGKVGPNQKLAASYPGLFALSE